MNPGLLIIPYVLILFYFSLRNGRALPAIWVISYLTLQSARNQIFGVSIYWSDIASVFMLFNCSIVLRSAPMARTGSSKWWYLVMFALSFGMASSYFRYNALAEPGYTLMRFALAFSPLLVVERMRASLTFFNGVLIGIFVASMLAGIVAIFQSLSPDWALFFEHFFFSDYSRRGLTDLSYGERLAAETVSGYRVGAMFGTSTVFAGASLLMGVLCWMAATFFSEKWMIFFGVPFAFTGCLLSYSRHGVLGMIAFVIATMTFGAKQRIKTFIAITMILLIASGFFSYSFFQERISKGSIFTDENLRLRVIDRPLEFYDRVVHEPSILFWGTGLGSDHIVRSIGDPMQYGFVSNSYLLFIFYAGLPAFFAILFLLLSSLSRANALSPEYRGICLGGVLASAIIIFSDNYTFFQYAIPFMFSMVCSLTFFAYSTVRKDHTIR